MNINKLTTRGVASLLTVWALNTAVAQDNVNNDFSSSTPVTGTMTYAKGTIGAFIESWKSDLAESTGIVDALSDANLNEAEQKLYHNYAALSLRQGVWVAAIDETLKELEEKGVSQEEIMNLSFYEDVINIPGQQDPANFHVLVENHVDGIWTLGNEYEDLTHMEQYAAPGMFALSCSDDKKTVIGNMLAAGTSSETLLEDVKEGIESRVNAMTPNDGITCSF